MTLLITGCGLGDTEFVFDMNSIGENSIFTINDEKCSLKEAKLYLCNYQNIYGKDFGVDLWKHEFKDKVDVSLEEYVKEITASELGTVMCMYQLAKEKDIQLSKEEKQLVKELTDAYYKTLNKYELSYMDLEKKDLEEYYTRYALAQKLYQSLTEGVNEEVSEDEARVIRVQMIFVKNEAKAKEVEKKLAENEDFVTVATAYNEAASVETVFARGELPEQVEKEAFRLENQEQTGMISSEDGYYFIRCLSKFEKELSEKNKDVILVRRRKQQFDDVFQSFIEKSTFVFHEELWNELKIDTSSKIKTDRFFEMYDEYFKE